MVLRSFPVQQTRTVTLDAAGTGFVRFVGPGVTWETITVDAIALTSDSDELPEARLYRGPNPTEGTLMATELDGSDGAFLGGGSSDALVGADTWAVEWLGGDPGAECRATLTGTLSGRS